MPLSEPFSGLPPAEVPLARAPLVRVISQIRFPTILAITDPAAVAPFQEQIRDHYPIAENQIIQRVAINAGTETPTVEKEQVWRFLDKAKKWRVSLAPTFVALETAHYTSRHDFLSRMSEIVASLERTTNPRVAQRVGLRYIDRIQNDALEELHDLVKPDFLGPLRLLQGAAQYVLTESVLGTSEGALIAARWGLIPPQTTFDPNVLEPTLGKSWILDLDMFSDEQRDFSAHNLNPLLEQFAQRIYAVFRFVVTERFLTYYGRDPQ